MCMTNIYTLNLYCGITLRTQELLEITDKILFQFINKLQVLSQTSIKTPLYKQLSHS